MNESISKEAKCIVVFDCEASLNQMDWANFKHFRRNLEYEQACGRAPLQHTFHKTMIDDHGFPKLKLVLSAGES